MEFPKRIPSTRDRSPDPEHPDSAPPKQIQKTGDIVRSGQCGDGSAMSPAALVESKATEEDTGVALDNNTATNVDNNNVDTNNVDTNSVDTNNVGNNSVDTNNVDTNNVDTNNDDTNNVDNNNVDTNNVDTHNDDTNNVDAVEPQTWNERKEEFMRWMNAQPENRDTNGRYVYVKYPKQSGDDKEKRLYTWIARKSRLTTDRMEELTRLLGAGWPARCFPRSPTLKPRKGVAKTHRSVEGLMEWMNAQPENQNGNGYVKYPQKQGGEEGLWYQWLQRLHTGTCAVSSSSREKRRSDLQALAENLGPDWADRCFPDPWLDGFRLMEDHWRQHRTYPTRKHHRKLFDWLRNSRRGGTSYTAERWSQLCRLFGVADWEAAMF